MIKSAKELNIRPIEINLLGEGGNAYYLLAIADKLAKRLNLDAKQIQSEMKSSDYENLVKVFDKYFGDFVILYR